MEIKSNISLIKKKKNSYLFLVAKIPIFMTHPVNLMVIQSTLKIEIMEALNVLKIATIQKMFPL